MNEKPYYVYTLAYPDKYVTEDGNILASVIFYIGKGTVAPSWTTVQCMDYHELEAKSGCNCKKCFVIRQIWERGLSVSKNKIFETYSEQEAIIFEAICIEDTYSGPYLTNKQHNSPPKQKKVETEKERYVRLYVQQVARKVFADEASKKRKRQY